MSTSTTKRRALTVLAAGIAAAGIASVPGTAHAMRPEPPVGAEEKVWVGGTSCATWESTGSAWVYVGIRHC
jgi:hypothetical protein